MQILAILFALVLAAVFGAAGVGKLTGSAQVTEVMGHVGVGPSLRGAIGALEVAAAVGLLIGIGVHWLGALAAGGLVLLMAGAVVFHLQAGDRARGITPPAVLVVLSLLEVIFFIAAD